MLLKIRRLYLIINNLKMLIQLHQATQNTVNCYGSTLELSSPSNITGFEVGTVPYATTQSALF